MKSNTNITIKKNQEHNGESPFSLIYGTKAIISFELQELEAIIPFEREITQDDNYDIRKEDLLLAEEKRELTLIIKAQKRIV